jgi:tetratricopeptide (TPR) repeat protein
MLFSKQNGLKWILKRLRRKHKNRKRMRKARNNNNFIDKTFTIIADVILRVFPASQQEKKAFSYYLNGLSAQDEGEYAEALNNYYQALQIEEDLYDRSIILYNIGLIYSKNGDYLKALKYYYFAIFINPRFTSALNNIAVIYHYQGIKAAEKKCYGLSESLLQKATFYWIKVVKIDPNSYIEAWNWLKTTRRVKF